MSILRLPEVDQLEAGSPLIVDYPDGAPPWRSIILVRTPAGELRAFWNVCKHLPVPLDSGAGHLPAGERLVCLTHGASFRLDDGRCMAGPCEGAKLDALPVEEDEQGHFIRPTPPGAGVTRA